MFTFYGASFIAYSDPPCSSDSRDTLSRNLVLRGPKSHPATTAWQLGGKENSELQVEHSGLPRWPKGFGGWGKRSAVSLTPTWATSRVTQAAYRYLVSKKRRKRKVEMESRVHNEHVRSSVMTCDSSTDNTLAPQIHFYLWNVSWWSQCIPEEHRGALFLMLKPIRSTEHILRSYCFLWMLKEGDIPII